MSKKAEKPEKLKEIKNTKKNLKTMSKSGKSHKLRTTSRVVKYGAIGFGRNIWLSIAATLVMTITLLILFITVIASAVLNATADSFRQRIDVTIFFKPGTSQETLASLEEIIKTDDNVREIETKTSEQEYEKFLDESKDDENLMTTLKDENMKKLMLQSMQSTMRIKVHDIDNIDSLKNLVETNDKLKASLDDERLPTYDVDHAEIQTITDWANIAKNGGLILSFVFLAISILVIFNTIRMAIYSRSEEIYMMKLVGADSNFIRGPFLVEAQMCGIISGIIAATLGYVGFNLVAQPIEDYGISISGIKSIIDSQWLILVYAAIICIGILIGSISARIAIHRYLAK
ncbi:permease-like cell division protein FtsX [Candidatus Saccharibacteria bacterium]|nr:permease-like cell division protein FtsX [Candidatus Saccharibacteria bacterium]